MPERLESLQLAFFLGRTPASALKLWTSVSSEEPSGFNTLPNGHSQVTVVRSDSQITINVQEFRVDCIIQGLNSSEGAPPYLHYPGRSKDDLLTTARALATSLHVNRVAVVMQGRDDVATAAKAVDLFKQKFPDIGRSIPDSADEASFQFVNNVKSGIGNRPLKHICRWQTMRYQPVSIMIGTMSAQEASSIKHAFLTYSDALMHEQEDLDVEAASAAAEELLAISSTLMTEAKA